MNRAYRLLWSEHLQQLIPAPETARARGKRKAVQGTCAAALATLAIAAQAMPMGGSVSAGSGSVARSGDAMTVTQSSPNLSLNWQSFSIAPSESVRFAQPSASAVALNRVIGSDASRIYGRLQANGQVFLLNPNGILFARTAQVDVGGLVASTLKLSDADFLAGRRTFSGSGGSVVNQGTINSRNGYVALLGAQVSNQGTITAQLGTVALAAGDKVTLDFAGDKLITVQVDESALNAVAENKQLIQADGGMVILTASAQDALLNTVVNNEGVIQARTLENRNGQIWLLGGNEGVVQVAGTLDASAPDGGNGGFIETSGAHVKVADSAVITTAAPYGKTGTWLLDPQDYTIAASGGDITGTALGANLGTSNVTVLSSSGAAAGNGDIFVNDNVSWGANTTLTLSAARNIDVNAVIAASGNGAGLTLIPATGGSGSYSFAASGRIDLTGSTPSLNIAGHAYTVINDVNALQNMSADLAGYYALGGNIDASSTSGWNGGAGFVPIGNSTTTFTGAFDGLNHSITGLTINRPSTNWVGLFGFSSGGPLAHVGLVNVSIIGGQYVGGLAGYNDGNTVRNSYSTGAVSGVYFVGGLVGDNSGTVSNSYSTGAASGSTNVGGLAGSNHGNVSNSYSTGAVTGAQFVGGLVGANYGGIVSNSYSTGAVTGSSTTTIAGGLVGLMYGGTVSNSYSTGAVTGIDYVGGLVGLIDFQGVGGAPTYSPGTVSNSYSTGAVTGGAQVGGLVGALYDPQGSVNNSFWDTQTSGMSTSAGGTGMTTAQMQTQANFTSATAANGYVNPNWDFTNVWRMYDGHTYPLLRSFLTPITVTANNATMTYNAQPYSGPSGVTYSISSAALFGTVAYVDTATGQPVVNAGTYTIVPAGLWSNQQGYDISYAPGTLTVNKAPALLTWSVTDSVSAYGSVPTLGQATLTGVAAGDDVSATVGIFRGPRQETPSATTGPGAYKKSVIGLTGADAANYTLSPTGNTTGRLMILPNAPNRP